MTADELAEAVRKVALAAQAGGVTHLRMRTGPVSEMLLAPLPPAEEAADKGGKRSRQRLFGEPYPGEGGSDV